MNLHRLVNQTRRALSDNSPVILTTLGVIGVGATAALSGRAALKAREALEAEYERLYRETPDMTYRDVEAISRRAKLKIVWKQLLPPAIAVVATCGCVIFANRIGNRRAAALATALTLSQAAFTEYSEKVIEKLGETKERKIRDEIAQDVVTRTPVGNVLLVGGDVLCFEKLTNRYFQSDMESIRKAVNNVNQRLVYDGSASVSDFLIELGLPTSDLTDELGWHSSELLEVDFTATIVDGRPCMVIDYLTHPIRGYNRLR